MRRALTRVGLLLLVSCAVVLGSTLPVAADETPPWSPGDEWGTATSTELSQWGRSDACDVGQEWVWTGPGGQITWSTVRCDGASTARGAALWQQPDGHTLPEASVLAGGEEQVWWLPASDQLVRRWVQDLEAENDAVFVEVSSTCSRDDPRACAQETAWVAQGVAAAMDGEVERVEYGLVDAIVMALVGPSLLWAVLVLPWRSITALLRPRYLMTADPPRVQDLTRQVLLARTGRAVRKVVWTLAGSFLVLVLALAVEGDDGAMGAAVIFGVPAIALLALTYRFAPPHPVERGRRVSLADTGARGVLGVALTTIAYGLLPVLLLVYLLVAVYGSFVPGWPVTSAAGLAGRPEPLVGQFYTLAMHLGRNPLSALFVLLVPGLLVLFALDLLGQRLRAAGMAQVLAHDRRPHYLYLRSFDEDTLRMPGLLRRRGLIGGLTVLRRVRFEEVLVRQLSMTGPVIAIAPPGTRLPPIGAARASFSNEEWQQHVERYARTARAVVLSATPREVRAGFGWEIDLVAHRLGHRRVMVVLGPWQKSQLVSRWRQFCQAVGHLPLFAPMAMPWVPAGVQLLAHSDRQGWRAWGAHGRTDWTYTMAVDQATREYLPDWSGPTGLPW